MKNTKRRKYNKSKHKRIAPRLESGDSRIFNGGGLPPEIKEALKYLAHRQNTSVSWIMEQLIIEAFGFNPPIYKERKRRYD